MRTILLTGATGMIGIEAPWALAATTRSTCASSPTRRAVGLGHPRLANPQIDAMTWSDQKLRDMLERSASETRRRLRLLPGIDPAQGRQPGQFHAIDHDLVMRWARIAHGWAHAVRCWCPRSAPTRSPTCSTCA
ncbi:MAG: hypothetical protein IPH76_18765 [Xanthomonadales bacterium]|nr:hypothetical protein [Xanthomonadales bacterium]